MNLDRVIKALEERILGLISMDDISATKISTLCNTLIKLYIERDKYEDKG